MDNFKSFLNSVEKLTDNNAHTDARIKIAKYFGLSDELLKLQALKQRHIELDHMTYEMVEERTEITKVMMSKIPEDLMEEIYSKL